MKKIFLPIAISLLAGCTSIQYGDVRYTSFLNRKSISELQIDVKPDGAKKVNLKGYRNDQVEALGIAVEAAVKGALSGK